MQHNGGAVYFDHIEWDDAADERGNLYHATAHGVSAAEIEQALTNAETWQRHRKRQDRRLVRSRTDGGRNVLVIVELTGRGIRPVTSWEVKG